MKEFFKKHTVVFCAILIIAVMLSNLLLGLLQERYSQGWGSYYLIEAGFKTVITVFLLILVWKWKLYNKNKDKKVLLGCIIGLLYLPFIIENLLPLSLVRHGCFTVDVTIIVSICLAKISVGTMEELGIRGVLLPLLCEKWTNK